MINKDLMDVVSVCRHRLVEQWLLFSEAVKTEAEREERLTLDVKSILFSSFCPLREKKTKQKQITSLVQEHQHALVRTKTPM